MGIISSIDSQSFLLTRKLLERHAPSVASILPEQELTKYPIDETTIELEVETINQIINALMRIGEQWLDDEGSEYVNDRKKILAYVLQQWVNIGEHAKKLIQLPSTKIQH